MRTNKVGPVVAFGLLFGCNTAYAQDTDSATWSGRERAASKPTWPGFGFASSRQEDSVKAVFIRQEHLTHTFGDFFKNSAGEWVVLHYIFGIPEGAQYIFTTTPCPALDEATFRENGAYWQDRRGAYYAALTSFSPQIISIRQADLVTFRYLGFGHLASDKYHVYQLGAVLPGLQPATLKVYTPGGRLTTEDWDFNNNAYLISGNVGYDSEGQRLPASKTRYFKIPSGYRLAYSLPHPEPKQLKAVPPKSR